MKNIIVRLCKEDSQDLVEYALLIMFVVLVSAAAINPLGRSIAAAYTKANNCITGDCGTASTSGAGNGHGHDPDPPGHAK
jgi:Flp pilus assembly pilin Flp